MTTGLNYLTKQGLNEKEIFLITFCSTEANLTKIFICAINHHLETQNTKLLTKRKLVKFIPTYLLKAV